MNIFKELTKNLNLKKKGGEGEGVVNVRDKMI